MWLFRQRGDLRRGRRGADDDGSAVPEEPDGDDALAVGAGVSQTRRVGGAQELQRAGLLEILDASGYGHACASS